MPDEPIGGKQPRSLGFHAPRPRERVDSAGSFDDAMSDEETDDEAVGGSSKQLTPADWDKCEEVRAPGFFMQLKRVHVHFQITEIPL